ncbi:hypothetical protein B0H14DRAFT_3433087 [Mycena olivaceomarginata]|nr:hypothetical protein B0H14DRAFT_3433087 [Mycena olivaceomarginata]
MYAIPRRMCRSSEIAGPEDQTRRKPEPNVPRGSSTRQYQSAYNIFISKELKIWKEANPEAKQSEGMKAVAVLWADSPENPKRGQPVTKRAPKAKEPKAEKKAAEDDEEEEDEEEEKENELATSDD